VTWLKTCTLRETRISSAELGGVRYSSVFMCWLQSSGTW
jgi:hypothetical protein